MKKILFLGLNDGQIHHEMIVYFLAKYGYQVSCLGLGRDLKLNQFLPKLNNLQMLDIKKIKIGS